MRIDKDNLRGWAITRRVGKDELVDYEITLYDSLSGSLRTKKNMNYIKFSLLMTMKFLIVWSILRTIQIYIENE